MDQETINSMLFKLNLIVEKVQNLEYKVDQLNSHLKHKHKQHEDTASNVADFTLSRPPYESPSQLNLNINNQGRSFKLNSSKYSNRQFIWTQDCDLILSDVFGVMDIPSLRNVRLVCRSWNRKVVPILSTKTKLDLNSWERDHDLDDTPLPISDLFEMFESPPDNIILFKNLVLSSQCLLYYDLQIQLLLREFGGNFQTISLETPKLEILRQVVGQWCPNLEELSICVSDRASADEEFVLPMNISLKLKSLIVVPSFGRFLNSGFLTQPLLQIIICSPEMKKICMADKSIFTDFFTGLASLVDITGNLEEMDLGDGINDLNVEDLNLPKVSKLNIRKKRNWVTPLLSQVSNSLETLTLGFPTGNYFAEDDTEDDDTGEDDGDHNIFPGLRKNYPALSNLKVFKLKGRLPPESSLRSMECGKMMNLQVLVINVHEGDLETVLMKSDLCDPLLSLRHLTLVGNISCVLSFQIIATLFPNLLKIKLGLCRKFFNDDAPDECLRDGLPKFSSLQDLKRFSLYLNCSVFNKLGEVVASLKELPGLTDFELGNYDEDRAVVSGVLAGIQAVNQISCIRLVNIALPLPESKGLLEELQARKTNLIIVDSIPDPMD